jgi:hypothetical protein
MKVSKLKSEKRLCEHSIALSFLGSIPNRSTNFHISFLILRIFFFLDAYHAKREGKSEVRYGDHAFLPSIEFSPPPPPLAHTIRQFTTMATSLLFLIAVFLTVWLCYY